MVLNLKEYKNWEEKGVKTVTVDNLKLYQEFLKCNIYEQVDKQHRAPEILYRVNPIIFNKANNDYLINKKSKCSLHFLILNSKIQESGKIKFFQFF